MAARLAFIAALDAGSAERLVEAADRFDAMGGTLFAAEALAAAAAEYKRGGDARSGRAAASRATALLARCEGARTPLVAAIEAEVPLTDREREIAVLASTGLTSRAIGERLFLSPRTVENHLQRAYTKLGVANREELAKALA